METSSLMGRCDFGRLGGRWDVTCFRGLQGGYDSETGPGRSLSGVRTLGTMLRGVKVGTWSEEKPSHGQSV